MSTSSVYDDELANQALQLMTYDSATDDELLTLATYEAEQDYQTEYDALFETTQAKKDILLRSIQDAEADYSESVEELSEYFDESSEKLSEEALSRGLGRSTYALDIQSANETDRQSALQTLLSEKVEAVNAIQEQIDALETEYLENQSYLSSKKTQDIESILEELKQERDDTIREVLEYNNELILDYKDYQLDKLEADRDYEIAKAKLEKSSSSSSGSSSSSSSKSSSNSLLDEWNSLTGSGKLKFYNDYYDSIMTLDIDTQKSIMQEVSGLLQLGYTPATSKTYNYYK